MNILFRIMIGAVVHQQCPQPVDMLLYETQHIPAISAEVCFVNSPKIMPQLQIA